jgi:hypothetical protein
MPLKRLAVGIAAAFLFSTLGLATSAQAIKRFTVTGGGGQTHIGNGLMIPIQAAAGPGTTGTMFPTLLIPVNGVPIVTGTVAKPIMTAGTKMAYQRRLNVPAGVLKRTGAKTTVGVKFSNPTVFAVATNLNASWPAAPAVFSTGAAVATTTIGPAFGGTMTYSNAIGSRFGGAAQFAITSNDPVAGDLFPAAPVTVYIKVNATTPPCTFMLVGMGPGCVAGAILAIPGPLGAIGGASTLTVMTPGVVITGANIAAVKMGLTPLGTFVPGLVTLHATAGTATAMVPAPFLVAMGAVPTNMATSQAGPWTTGQVIIANPAAGGGGETFTLSGNDLRTANGGGTIQMVSGSVSARAASGANANRGWVRLDLSPTFPVPSMSLTGLATMVALMLLAFGYTMRRRLFA